MAELKNVNSTKTNDPHPNHRSPGGEVVSFKQENIAEEILKVLGEPMDEKTNNGRLESFGPGGSYRVLVLHIMLAQSILQITDTKIPVFPNILDRGPVFAMGTIRLD